MKDLKPNLLFGELFEESLRFCLRQRPHIGSVLSNNPLKYLFDDQLTVSRRKFH